MDEAGIGNLGGPQVEFLGVGESLKVGQTGIGDLGVPQVENLEAGEVLELGQAGVCEPGTRQERDRKEAELLEQLPPGQDRLPVALQAVVSSTGRSRSCLVWRPAFGQPTRR